MEYEKSPNKARYSSSVPVNVPLMGRSRVEFREKLLQEDECVSSHVYTIMSNPNPTPIHRE